MAPGENEFNTPHLHDHKSLTSTMSEVSSAKEGRKRKQRASDFFLKRYDLKVDHFILKSVS